MVEVGKLLQSAGVGVVDEVLQYADAHATVPRTGSFKTWQDYGRIGLFALGVGLPSFMPRYKDLADTIAIAVTPLLVKTLAVPLKSAMGISSPMGAPTWVPTRVPTRTPAPVSRGVGRNYYPNADKVLAY